MIKELPWIAEARTYLGIEENKDIAKVNEFWVDVKRRGNSNKPNIAWCSAFVGSMLKRQGVDIFNSTSPRVIESSQYWLGFGEKIEKPIYGCIVIFRWSPNSGHVGFVVGQTPNGNLIVLGGNQDNRVTEGNFKTGNIVGYRWIPGFDKPDFELPVKEMLYKHIST